MSAQIISRKTGKVKLKTNSEIGNVRPRGSSNFGAKWYPMKRQIADQLAAAYMWTYIHTSGSPILYENVNRVNINYISLQ